MNAETVVTITTKRMTITMFLSLSHVNTKNPLLCMMHLQNHDRKLEKLTVGDKLFELQKIIRGSACGIRLNLTRCRVKLKEILLHMLPNLKYCSHISTSIAVIWCTEHCHHIFVLHRFEINYFKIKTYNSSLSKIN